LVEVISILKVMVFSLQDLLIEIQVL
jgi:hypothetical protein